MSKETVIRTCLENPPEVLEYWWAPLGETEPQYFPVKGGIVEGLTTAHPRWLVLEHEWKLVVERVEKGKPQEAVKEVS